MQIVKKLFLTLVLTGSIMTSVQANQPVSLPAMPAELQGKTITMIVPWNPGGDTDTIQRMVAEQVSRMTNLIIVISNRGGARGIIGGRDATQARPDGLTLLGSSNETFVLNPVLEDQAVDFKLLQPVSIHAVTPQFLYTGVNSPIRNVDDIVKAARTDPKFNVGCNATHQCMYISQFLDHYGIKPYIILYKTPAEMGIAAARGDIHLYGAGAASGMPFVKNGSVRAVAVTWPTKMAVFPDAEPLGQKIKSYRANNLQMISVPAGTPKHIVEYYNQVFRLAVKSPELVKKFQELSIISSDLTVPEVERELAEELRMMMANKKYAIRQ